MAIPLLCNILMYIKQLKAEKESVMISHIYLQHFAEVKMFLVMWLMAHPMILQKIVILGTEFTLTVHGGLSMLHMISFKQKRKMNFMALIISQTEIRTKKCIS